LSGAIAGVLNEVLLHDQQTIRFTVPMTRPIAVGDVVAGCDKTPETCRARFGSIVKFPAVA